MSYVEMTIDSLRHAMHKDEWVILLKDKAGQRYLPVYVDKACGDMVASVLKGEQCEGIIDDEIEKMLAMGNEVVLMIDGAEDGRLKGRFVVGQEDESFDVAYSIGKALALAVRTGTDILVKERIIEVKI